MTRLSRLVIVASMLLTVFSACETEREFRETPSIMGRVIDQCPKVPTSKRLFVIDDDLSFDEKRVAREGAWYNPNIRLVDPDGGLELLYGLRESQIHLLGLTCAVGMVSTEACADSARRIVDTVGAKLPVYAGQNRPGMFDGSSEAVDFLQDMLDCFPGEVEIVATGPLTNIATLLTRDPAAPSKWRALHVGSGELGTSKTWQISSSNPDGFFFDVNLGIDFPAAKLVFERGGDFTVYPNDLMESEASFLLPAHVDVLRAADTPLATYVWDEVEERYEYQRRVDKSIGLGVPGAVPLAMAIDPSFRGETETLPLEAVIWHTPGPVGAPWGHPRNEVSARAPARPVVRTMVDAERFRASLLDRVQ